jgi:hypothetical protein
MKRTANSIFVLKWVAATAVVVAGIAGCAAEREAADTKPEARGVAVESFDFEGAAGSRGHVTRLIAADGSEKLHGETVLSHEGAAPRSVIEDVTLDAGGRLVRAEITTSGGAEGATTTRVRLDAARRLVEVVAGAGASSFQVSSDAPWVYAPTSSGRPVATPISAWVAKRAPETAPWLRLVSADERRAALMPRDQIVVPTELGTTVVLGSNGADVDRAFVSEIRAGERSPMLSRVKGPELVL